MSFFHREDALHSFRENRQIRGHLASATGTDSGPRTPAASLEVTSMQRITETVSKNSLFPLTEAQGEGQRPAATARGPGARPEAQPPPQPPPPPLTHLRDRELLLSP